MRKFGDWEVEDIEMEDIEWDDAPDFSNAFIASATVNGHEATEEELDKMNDDGTFVYDCLIDYIY